MDTISGTPRASSASAGARARGGDFGETCVEPSGKGPSEPSFGRDPYCIRVPEKDLPGIAVRDLAFFRDLAVSNIRWLAPLGIFMALGVLAGVPQPLVIKEIIDGISAPGASFPDLGLYLVLFAGLALAGQATGFFRTICQARFRQGVAAVVRRRVLDHVTSLPPRFFDSEDTGYLMSRVFGDAVQMEGLVSGQLVSLVTDAARFGGGLVILFFIHAELALVASAALPLLLVSVRLWRRTVARIADRQMELGASFWKDLQETFAGMMLIKTRGAEALRRDGLMAGIGRMFDAEMRSVASQAASSACMALAASAGIVAVLWFGASEVLAGRLTVGGLIAFNAYLGFLYGPSRALSNFPVAVQPALVAYRRLRMLLSMRPERSDGADPGKLRGEVRFEGATFSYGGPKAALNGVTIAVPAGGRVGITGLSGAGKSTMAKLVMGFYDPGEGRVLVDGRDVREYRPALLRPRIGYLQQEAFFFSDTIRSNLGWAAPKASEGDMKAAMGAAGLGEFLDSLEKGLDEKIGERGLRLSGGERQRLAAARMIASEPDMLVLDEFTSHLDPETELKVRDAVLGAFAGKTVIVISNRLSALAGLDSVFVLEGGRVVQEGPLDRLMAADGPLRRIHGLPSAV